MALAKQLVSSALRLCGSNVKVQTRNASYKAAVLRELKAPLKIEDVKAPKKLKTGEIRVAVESCGVNSTDALICQGEFELKPKLPFIPGFEIAGTVKELGPDVSGFRVGDRVLGLNKENFSGFAQQCVLAAEDLWVFPDSIKFEEAAALADAYSTALLGMARRANLQEGDTVLVTAAAGGLGLAAVDLAANVYRAKVIGVCGTEDKAELVREKGAWAALTYNPKNLKDKVNEVTEGKGVRVVFDAVGGQIFQDAINCVAHEGKVIVAGFASKQVPQIQTSSLLPKSFSLVGVSLTHYRKTDPQVYRQDINFHEQAVEDVIDMCEQGLISPHVSAEFDLDEVNEALKFLEERKSTGKVVLELN
ncbi:hypothetical protein B566_EDAN013896 [Ephemera danica]|nr:hypothetical protein B566_EDAN013896 [Ephemera danica]